MKFNNMKKKINVTYCLIVFKRPQTFFMVLSYDFSAFHSGRHVILNVIVYVMTTPNRCKYIFPLSNVTINDIYDTILVHHVEIYSNGVLRNL